MQPKMQPLPRLLPCLLLAFTALVSAQQRVDTNPSVVTVLENQENVNLLCRVGDPLKTCSFTLPGRNGQFILDPNESSPEPGTKYYGDGLDKGACGMTIERITGNMSGFVTCSLLVGQRFLEGRIEIVVAFAEEEPYIEVITGGLTNQEINKEFTARCTVARSNPAASITWLLDDDPIYEGVRTMQPHWDNSTDQGSYSVVSTMTRMIRAEDNGKRLICQAQHMAYTEGVSRTQIMLNVNFPPQELPEHKVYGLQLGRTATVSLVIRANPMPRILWSIDGIDYDQGIESERYSVPIPESLGNHHYNVSLTIAGLRLEDLSKTYMMRASNAFGVKDYPVTLTSQDEVVNESSGVGIGEIVGLVLAVLIVLTAVALIFVARATGRWCFRGASLNTDINPDSEAQITPHPHDDDIDDKLQMQDPAAHFVHEGDEKHAATNGKYENGKQTKAQQQQQYPAQPPAPSPPKLENGKTDSKGSSTSTSAAKIGETSDTESAEVKQPMTKTQRLKNIFAGRGLKRTPADMQEETAAPEVATGDEQDAKASSDPANPAKDEHGLVYAELDLKPAGGEISFVNKPSDESTEYAEILYVQQQTGSGVTPAEQPKQPHVPRQHSGEDNRPVIDGSIHKPTSKGDSGTKVPGGK